MRRLLTLLLFALPNHAVSAAPAAWTQSEAERQAAREEAFRALLTDVTLEGFTTLTGEEGVKGDRYTLKRVTRQEDGRWRFEAVIHFGKQPVPIAVNLPVTWAGETPVVTVDALSVPLMGTYDARVLFHGDQYAGVWSGAGYGGQIFGKVVKQAAAPAPGDGTDGATGDAAPPAAAVGAAPPAAAVAGAWPQFRGPGASGIAEGHPLPVGFDLASGENVVWRVPVPGLAHSSPVIYGERIFLTTAVRADGDQELRVGLYGDIMPVEDQSRFRFEVLCLDRGTGKELWRRAVWEGVPAIQRHPKGSHAASTPAVDGERVVAFFGSEGLYAFDHDGEPLWQRSFGVLDSGFFMVKNAQWGFASSPVLHEGKVILQCDVQDDSFLAVLDAASGADIWRVAREEEPGWSTPTVHIGPDRAQILCNGWKHIGGYALADGAELWRAAPGGDIPVPTPVVAHGLVYITNAHGPAAPILAIQLGASGRVSFKDEEKAHLAWGTPKRGNYMQTPLVYGDLAYFCRDNGVLTCYDARTGEQHYSERLDEGRAGYTSSGVAGDGKLYFTSEEGTVITVRPGTTFEVLARSALGEEHMATPAIANGRLYFRSRGHLTAIGL